MNNLPHFPELTVQELDHLKTVINNMISGRTAIRVHEVHQSFGVYHAPYTEPKGNLNTSVSITYIIPGEEDKYPINTPFEHERNSL